MAAILARFWNRAGDFVRIDAESRQGQRLGRPADGDTRITGDGRTVMYEFAVWGAVPLLSGRASIVFGALGGNL